MNLHCPKCGKNLGVPRSIVRPDEREWCSTCKPPSDEPSGPNVQHPDWRPGDRPIEAPREDPMEPPVIAVDDLLAYLDSEVVFLGQVGHPNRAEVIRQSAAEIRRLRDQLARDRDGLSSLLALLAARSAAMIPYVPTNSRAADRLRETLDKLVRPALARFGKDVLPEDPS